MILFIKNIEKELKYYVSEQPGVEKPCMYKLHIIITVAHRVLIYYTYFKYYI